MWTVDTILETLFEIGTSNINFSALHMLRVVYKKQKLISMDYAWNWGKYEKIAAQNKASK